MTFRHPSVTRIAPTPSGYLHLGNIISFAYTHALARKYGAKIHLRIDDLDRARFRMEYLEDIFETLTFLGFSWDEGPRNAPEFLKSHTQLNFLPDYSRALETLRQQNILYACICTRTKSTTKGGTAICCCEQENIPFDQKEVQWRLNLMPAQQITRIELASIEPTQIEVKQAPYPSTLSHLQVRRKDGFPAYQLASVIDDQRLGVDLIVRGADLLESTLAQIFLSSLIPENKLSNSIFFHHALITDEYGQKLSKSSGATSIHFLRKAGSNRAQIFSRIASAAGLSPTIKTLEELSAALMMQSHL